MSLSFAMSAFGSSDGGQTDYTNKSSNARALLKEMGFADENIAVNDWFTKKPTTDSIGVIIGNKPVKVKDEEYTLIAVAVRGGGYEQEWASNFTIGTSGQHQGFNTAKNNVLSYLKQYISKQGISGQVKIWVTGYSRAAATANLVSGELDKGIALGNDISYQRKDVYGYCFETPAGALSEEVNGDSKYDNIFNIINQSDPVPYVAPAAMGFGRYGIDRYLPSAESEPKDYADLKKKMLAIYQAMPTTEKYVVDDFQMKKISVDNLTWNAVGFLKDGLIVNDTKHNYSQGVFLSDYVTILSKKFIVNRENYVDRYQNEIREICSVVFGCTDEQSGRLTDSIVSQVKSEWYKFVGAYIWNTGINPWGTEEKALKIVSGWLRKALQDAGITDYNELVIDYAGVKLSDLMLALVSNHPNYFTTAVLNGEGLGAAHYPELCYAWLASMDSNYVGTTANRLNNGGFRIIRINCEVDVKVFDAEQNKIASIINEQSDETGSYIAGVDNNGQKYVVLPVDETFYVEMTAREKDSVNYSINEYSALAGITVIEVVRSNMAQKGTITVSKSGEVFSSVFENNGLYQPIFAVSGLEGAVYEITAAEDIYTLDGTLRASKGEVVDTITTGADGTAKSKELYLGKYEVKEITAPFGMVLNDEIHSVELVYAGQNMAVTETATSFYNERQRVEIDLTKSLEVDKNYGIGNNGEIFDVTFGLYAEKDIVAADGTVISADGLIEIISFDENGYGKATTDLPFGSYYVKEISTNSA